MLNLFDVSTIFNAKFNLALGMVRISRGLPKLWCLWDAFITSILKYIRKQLSEWARVIKEPLKWFANQIDRLVPVWCSFYPKVVPSKLWYYICEWVEIGLHSFFLAKEEVRQRPCSNRDLGCGGFPWNDFWYAGSSQGWDMFSLCYEWG